jgi:uncharacterized membrane protein YfcA
MEILAGFLIALSIGLTGVGGGVITAPVLILFFRLPPAEAVGTALIFVAAVKIFAVPVYLWRRQVDFRLMGYMLAGGVPGVILGSLALNRFHAGRQGGVVLAVVGAVVVLSAITSLLRLLLKAPPSSKTNRLAALVAASAFIGMEVGFSSAGAGALGTVVLLQLTTLSAAEVVGTDLVFGFVLALLGGGFHFTQGSFHAAITIRLIAGGIFGAALGAYVAGWLPKRTLRVALSLWLVWLGSQLWLRGLALLVQR